MMEQRTKRLQQDNQQLEKTLQELKNENRALAGDKNKINMMEMEI
jgi:hypothetical protein